MALAQEPRFEIDRVASVGLGWFALRVGGRQLLVHGGATAGFSSALVLDPDRHMAVAVLASAAAAPVDDIAIHALAPSWSIRLAGPPPEQSPVAVPIEVLRPYMGTYALPDADVTLAVTDGGKGLVARVDGGDPIPLIAAGPDRLFVADMDSTLFFDRDADGTIRGVLLRQLGEEIRGVRVADS